MSDDVTLTVFPAGIMDKGVDVFGPQFRSDLVLSENTYNVTDGLSQGIGVRNGMAPLPGQSDKETPANLRCNNIAYSEGTSSATRGLTRRTRFFRLIPITMGEFDDLTSQKQFLAALVSKTSTLGADDYLDLIILSEYESAGGSDYYERVRHLYAGLHPSTWDGDTSYYLKTELLYEGAYTDAKVLNYFRYDSAKTYISSTVLTVSNRKIPMKWMYGRTPVTAANTLPDYVNLWRAETVVGDPTYPEIFGGLPSQNRKNASTGQRSITVYGISAFFDFSDGWRLTFNLNSNPNAIKPGTGYVRTDDHYDLGEMTLDTAFNGSNSGVESALINDPEAFTEAGYTAILACGDKPAACIIQDWVYQNNKKVPQWVDLTEKVLFPHTVKNSTYDENGTPKGSCFKNWPDFVRGTLMVNSAGGGPALAGAATGILQANTVYEITFSLYNKRLNFETNVGDPVKVQLTATGSQAISLSVSTANEVQFYNWASGGSSTLDFPFLDFDFPIGGLTASEHKKFLNYIEYRFYYRVEGSFEWLPAGSFDAAELWFRPDPQEFALICKGEVAALPGGQPGGFNDYSPLPKQQYRCVVNYKNRAFWISSTSIFFSLENNIFAYPVRNAITAKTGEFLGALVHNYPGESDQSSRLIIFSNDAIYVARFTGDKLYQAIRVSPNTVGEFPVDGSDLIVDFWTSISSFSHRSAAIADGILYYWGPQGIYRDNGTDTPEKISKRLEPNVFNWYDPTRTDEIFTSFDPTTKEITWFYPPVDDDTHPTHALVYNTESDTFLPQRFSSYIDDAYTVDFKVDDHPELTTNRQIINERTAEANIVQRPYLFDFKNDSGDTAPLLDMVVKQVSTPASGQRRLTLATGYDATNFNTIAVGSYIALNQTKGYAPTAAPTATNMIAKVAAVGVGTIDIILPDDAVLANCTPTYDEYFPFWQKGATGNGLHGFDWQIETKYWIPGGVNWYGMFCWIYCLLKYEAWAKNFTHEFEMAYRTPSGGDFISDLIEFVENSDGAMQLYHALRQGDANNQGQALKLQLSGSHIGEPWVLQYLQADVSRFLGNNLKEFTG